MVKCFCLTNQCRGKDVDEATHKRHQRGNKKVLLNKMEKANAEAVEKYQARIGQHLLEDTLSNRSAPVGRNRLWAKAPLSSFDLSSLDNALNEATQPFRDPSLPARPPTLPRPGSSLGERVRHALDKISILELQIDALVDRIPCSRSDPSCNQAHIDSLYETAQALIKQLQAISVSASSVASLKSTVEAKAQSAVSAIDALQDEFLSERDQGSTSANVYNSGKSLRPSV
jgi:FtsZ-binding cell division protein ZapB